MSEPEYIDATPTWESMLELMFLVLEKGQKDGKLKIKGEFRRMAQAADKYNELVKEPRTPV